MNESFLEHVRDGWSVLRLQPTPADDDVNVPTWPTRVDYGSGPVRLAVSDDGNRRLLVPISESARVPAESAGQGIAVRDSRLHIGAQLTRFIDVICLDSRLESIFDTIAEQMLIRLSAGTPPSASVAGVLDDCREMLRRAGGSLSREMLLGLAGELRFLRELVAVNPDALTAWEGPGGGRHDFVGTQATVEVKSSWRRTSHTVQISAIDQLEPMEDLPLYLLAYRFEQPGQGGESLHDLLQTILDSGASSELLRQKMEQLGVTDWRRDEQLKTFRTRLLAEKLYQVGESFPRLTPGSFVGDRVPDGITGCTYTIDLDKADNYLITDPQVESLKQGFST